MDIYSFTGRLFVFLLAAFLIVTFWVLPSNEWELFIDSLSKAMFLILVPFALILMCFEVLKSKKGALSVILKHLIALFRDLTQKNNS